MASEKEEMIRRLLEYYSHDFDDDDEFYDKLKELHESTSSSTDYGDKSINSGAFDISSDKINQNTNMIDSAVSFFENIKKALSSNLDMDPGRLMGLTDGIFGMVMTLLAFGVALPEARLMSNVDIFTFLQSILPTIGTVLISFILVSSFWIYHHEFIRIKTLNMTFLWLSIFYLASISFIPFTTSLICEYGSFFFAELTFGVNIFLVLLFFLVMIYYASKMDFFVDRISHAEMIYIQKTFYMIFSVTFMVILGNLFISPLCEYLFLIIPVISTFRDFTYKHIKQ